MADPVNLASVADASATANTWDPWLGAFFNKNKNSNNNTNNTNTNTNTGNYTTSATQPTPAISGFTANYSWCKGKATPCRKPANVAL